MCGNSLKELAKVRINRSYKMGNARGGILKKSLLGCVLTHWKDIVGTGGMESKKTLIQRPPLVTIFNKLESKAKWPLNGSIDYNTLLQLMLFLRREGKWDEVSYADMFFTL